MLEVSAQELAEIERAEAELLELGESLSVVVDAESQ
jgi:hypothetical protein